MRAQLQRCCGTTASTACYQPDLATLQLPTEVIVWWLESKRAFATSLMIHLPRGRGLTISVVVLVLRMVRMPGTDGGSDDDGIFVRGHGVLYVGWNEQEASDGIRLEVLKVERFSEADLQYALNDRNPGVAGM